MMKILWILQIWEEFKASNFTRFFWQRNYTMSDIEKKKVRHWINCKKKKKKAVSNNWVIYSFETPAEVSSSGKHLLYQKQFTWIKYLSNWHELLVSSTLNHWNTLFHVCPSVDVPLWSDVKVLKSLKLYETRIVSYSWK